jgi:hypothetical protein
LDLLSDILMVKWLPGLASSAFDSPLPALLATASSVFFTGKIIRRFLTGKIVRRHLDTDQARVDASQMDQRLGLVQLDVQTTEFCLECVDFRLSGGGWLGRAPRWAWFQGFQGRLQRLIAQLVEPGRTDPQLLTSLGNRQLAGDGLQEHT